MKAKEPRALVLTVAEVKEMVASLEGARTLRSLTGRQRQQLQEAHNYMIAALNHAQGGMVRLPIDVMLKLLRCATMTQTWLSEMLTELDVGRKNEF